MTLEEKFISIQFAYRSLKGLEQEKNYIIQEYIIKANAAYNSTYDRYISQEDIDRINKLIERELNFLYDKKIKEAQENFELAMKGERYPGIPEFYM